MANYSFRETRRLRHLRLALGVLTISLPCAVAPGTTATTLTLAPTAVSTVFYAGEAITYTATVSGASGTPTGTGTVTFTIDGSISTPFAVDQSHNATIVLHPSAGTHSIGAGYSGDSIYSSSVSNTLTMAVNKAVTAVQMASNPPQIAQPVSIRAAVTIQSPGDGLIGGTVDFANGTTSIAGCKGVPVQNGVAICSTAFPQVESVTIGATYSGDSNTATSTGSLLFTVGKCSAGVYLAAYPAAPANGAPVTLGVLVLGATGVAAPTGTVTISDGTSVLANLPVGPDGRTALTVPSGTLPPLGTGTHTLMAGYSGDANYGVSQAPALTVVITGKAATTTALTSTTAQIAQLVKISATVSMAGSASGSASGTVDFSNAANPIAGCAGVPLQNGVALCNTSFSQTGTVTINAGYSGDTNNAASKGSMTLTVGKSISSVVLSAAPAAPSYGAVVTLTALVTGAPGVANPSGTVAFSDGTTALGTAALGADGRASLVVPSGSLPALGIGTHSISAAYSGDTNYLSATAPPVAVVVTKPTTAVTLSSPSAQIAQPVKITAAISPGTAGGTVDFSNAANPIAGCTGVAVQNGAALCNTSFPQLGTVTIGARYSGDANNSAGTGSLVLTVGKCNAGAYLAGSPAAPVSGAVVTLSTLVTRAPGVANPTGTVTFSDGTIALGTATLAGDGRASLVMPSGSLPALGIGTHSIGAAYSGDTNYLSATAPPVAVVVTKPSTAVTLSPPTAQIAQPVKITAAISPGTAGGTVDFSNAANPIAGCTGVAIQNGAAVCSTSFPQLGTVTIAASYSGDANNSAGTGSLVLTVGKCNAGAYLAGSPAAPVSGAVVTLSTLVTGAPGVANPTGTVTFSDGTAALGPLTLGSDGHATLVVPSGSLAPLITGSHNVIAVYSGDANYLSATAPPLVVVVGKAASTVALAAAPNSPKPGQNTTLTATVSPAGSGTVAFSNGTAPISGCTGAS